VEPDPRDFAINQLPRGWAHEGPSAAAAASIWSGWGAHIVFLGDRPYIGLAQPDPNDLHESVVRLSPGGDSWDVILGRGTFPDVPIGTPITGVFGGLLHLGDSSFEGDWITRLNQDGQWQDLAGLAQKLSYPCGGTSTGDYLVDMTVLGGSVYALWQTSGDPNCDSSGGSLAYVSRFVDGAWQVVGGGPLHIRSYPASLRVVGGRLYVAWFDGRFDSPGINLHVSRLADDGNSWISEPDPVRSPGYTPAILSAVSGVPYFATSDIDGSTHRLLVEKLVGGPDSIGSDDGEGSGPGTDPDIQPEPGWHPLDFGSCGWVIDGTSHTDRITGFSNERNDVHGLADDDVITGSMANDCLSGDFGVDHLTDDLGDDLLRGGGGPDVETGGAGQDVVIGNAGDDILRGGLGHDHLWGNRGNDRINARDGRHDWVDCGAGHDLVFTDGHDDIASNCEVVRSS
jgi:hypothetical protein